MKGPTSKLWLSGMLGITNGRWVWTRSAHSVATVCCCLGHMEQATCWWWETDERRGGKHWRGLRDTCITSFISALGICVHIGTTSVVVYWPPSYFVVPNFDLRFN